MIRRINYDDVSKIVELENNTLGTTLGEKMLDMAIRSPLAYYYCYEENNKLLGYISTMFDGEIVEILNFCVDKEYQHQGIGKKLISYVLSYLNTLGAKSSILEVRESNINAINLYKKIGYKQISVRKNYYSNGENALVLEFKFIDIDEIEENYTLEFSKKEIHDNYINYYDDNQKDKYCSNFYVTNDKKGIKSILKDNKRYFIKIDSNVDLSEYLKDYEKDITVNLVSHIYNLKLNNVNDYKCRIFEFNDYANLRNFIYKEDLRFGETYAVGNANRLTDMLANNDKFICYLAFDNDTLVGMIHAYVYESMAKFEEFVILESYRNKGYGKALFNYSLVDLEKRGIKLIDIEAEKDDYPINIYKSWGFIEIKDNYSFFKELEDGKN